MGFCYAISFKNGPLMSKPTTRGWVYVLSNKGHPNLVKVGFSTKDPQKRAEDLYTTGAPHKFVVEYDVLVEAPESIERKVHKALRKFHENREYCKCSPEQAVLIIRRELGDSIIVEKYHRIEREKFYTLKGKAFGFRRLRRNN